MDDKGTYLSLDNGHLNIKKQLYAKAQLRKGLATNSLMGSQGSPQTSALAMKNKFDNGTPGPGAYETNQSSV